MSEKSINELSLNSITISNSNYSNSEGYTAQSNTLQTNNSGVLLVNGIPISSGGGGAVDNIVEGDGISVTESPSGSGTFIITNTGVLSLTEGTNITITGTNDNLTINSTGGGGVDAVTGGTGISVTETVPGSGTFEIENVGVLSLTAGNGIDVDFNTGDINISSTVNPADYYTIANADATFQTQADMANYSTTTEANALYQPIGSYQTVADMANYSTTVEADALYNPLTVTSDKTLQTESPLIPVGTIYNIFTGLPTGVESGTYIYSIYLNIQSYDDQGNSGAFMGSGQIGFLTYADETPANKKIVSSQAFSQGGQPTLILPVSLSGIVQFNLNSSFQVNVLVDSLAQGGTQYSVKEQDPNESPIITFLKIR